MTGSSSEKLIHRVQSIIGELKRRKVFQVTSVYLVAAWGLSAGAADIFEVLEFPAWASRYFVIALFAMTPVVIVIAWVFELSRSGIQRDRGPDGPASQPTRMAHRNVVNTVDQTTVLAFRHDVPVITVTWQGQEHRFTDNFSVGRDDACALQIIDPMISRQHAKFEYADGHWQVRDLGSANGIIVEGKKVDNAVLHKESTLQLYPNGPQLSISIGSTINAETRLV